MAGNIQPIPQAVHMGVQPTFCSQMYEFTEAITQIAVRILFVTASILMAAAAFPISWHAVVIPVVSIGTTILAGFFYSQSFSIRGPLFELLQPLVKPVRVQENGEFPAHYPADAPRGFVNRGTQNCAFNSIAEFFDSEPAIAHWVRHPLTDETDLPAFQNFLAGYNPPAHMVDAFNAHVAEAPLPRISIPALFSEFLEIYQPPLADHIAFNAIRSTYQNIRLLQDPFSQFYQANDQAIQDRQAVSRGNAQNLRLALNRVTQLVDPNPHHQMDASEAMGPFLDVLPDNLKTHVETTYHINAAGLPAMAEPPQPKVERSGFLSLPIRGPDQGTLQGLFQYYCNSTEHEAQRYWGVDGQRRDYPVERATVELLEPPPALRFQIMRFGPERPAVSWLSRWFPKIFPPLEVHGIKLDPPIECPDEFAVTLKDGRVCRYRLSAFVNHHGSCGGGHYTSARIVNGHKYLISDEEVILVDPAKPEDLEVWNNRLRHAYLLCYLPVVEPALAAE